MIDPRRAVTAGARPKCSARGRVGRSLPVAARTALLGLAWAWMLLLNASPASARTITLTAEDCDQAAVISAKYPKMSWAAILGGAKVLNTENQVQLYPDMAVLMRFGLAKIPKDMRVTKAELTLPVDYMAGTRVEVTLRRLVAEWGNGVCHTHRMQHPRKLEWAQPGARGGGTDRAAKNSGVYKFEKVGEYVLDVTEDLELWHTGAVANHGWILVIEPVAGPIYMPSPYAPHAGGPKRWKLQVTYEPQ